MKKSNFDLYLEEQMKDPEFVARFEKAGRAWDVAMQITALRRRAKLSQGRLAKLLGTSQQQVSRLESPGYEGHTLRTLRRVAEVLHARMNIAFEPITKGPEWRVAEPSAPYGVNRQTLRRTEPMRK